MRVVQPRDDDAAAEVDDVRRGERRLVDADAARDPPAGDRERPLRRDLRVERPDQAVLEDHAGNLDRPAASRARRAAPLHLRRAARRVDGRAARDPGARADARPRADRAARGRDRPLGRVPVGRRRALPRERPLRDPRRRGARRRRRERADDARRDRGGLEGLRDERPDPRGPGARRARDQARGHRRAEGALPAAARLGRVARRVRADRGRCRLRRGRASHRGAPRRRRLRPRRLEALHHERRRRRPLRRASRRPIPTAGHRGISAFVVEADAPGLEVGRIEPKMGIKGSTTGELFFDDCRVPAANRLGEEGEGFPLAMRVLDRSRPGIAAQGLGLAQGATDYALEYANERETLGDADREPPARRGDARRHGDEVRGGARPALPLRQADRRRRRRARADEALGDDEALLHRRRDGGDDRRRPGARRLRLHAGVPRRADDARRQDHPDLRGDEPDPAARDRPRAAAREPVSLLSGAA